MRYLVESFAGIGLLALAAVASVPPDTPQQSAGIVVVPGRTASVPHRSSPPAARAEAPAPPARLMAARATWWRPIVSDTWQWQLTGRIDTSYDVAAYDIDLFDAPDAVFAQLRQQGRRIVCYFSAGSSETWRADHDQFLPADQGRALGGWAGERWLDVRSANVRRIMAARVDRAAARGCDGVEPDNVDGYANRNGLGLTAADQLDYNRFLAREAHARGLAVGLKNDLAQVAALAPAFDFAVNEQCNQYRECETLRPFTAAGKPVWNAEYVARYRNDTSARNALCASARMASIRTLVLPLKLNGTYRYSCD